MGAGGIKEEYAKLKDKVENVLEPQIEGLLKEKENQGKKEKELLNKNEQLESKIKMQSNIIEENKKDLSKEEIQRIMEENAKMNDDITSLKSQISKLNISINEYQNYSANLLSENDQLKLAIGQYQLMILYQMQNPLQNLNYNNRIELWKAQITNIKNNNFNNNNLNKNMNINNNLNYNNNFNNSFNNNNVKNMDNHFNSNHINNKDFNQTFNNNNSFNINQNINNTNANNINNNMHNSFNNMINKNFININNNDIISKNNNNLNNNNIINNNNNFNNLNNNSNMNNNNFINLNRNNNINNNNIFNDSDNNKNNNIKNDDGIVKTITFKFEDGEIFPAVTFDRCRLKEVFHLVLFRVKNKDFFDENKLQFFHNVHNVTKYFLNNDEVRVLNLPQSSTIEVTRIKNALLTKLYK